MSVRWTCITDRQMEAFLHCENIQEAVNWLIFVSLYSLCSNLIELH